MPLLLPLTSFGILGFALTSGLAGAAVGGSVNCGVCDVVGSGVAAVGVPTGPTMVPPALPPAPLHIAATLVTAIERRIFVFIKLNELFDDTNISFTAVHLGDYSRYHCCCYCLPEHFRKS